MFMLRKMLSIMVSSHHSQAGFTLLEVLITLIILSIGLLGLAGLQTMSLRANHEAYLRGQAVVQAYDIADRMRSNRKGTEDGDYSYGTAALGTKETKCETAKTAGGGCTPQQMAQNDLFRWNEANRASLPSGIGIICQDNTPDSGTFDGINAITPECNTVSISDAPWVVKLWWVDDRTGVVGRYVTSLGSAL